MSKPPMLLLSLPNSGTTWLGRVIADALHLRYFEEYFNPLRNVEHEERLIVDFGCELASAYKNIIKRPNHMTLKDIDSTWFADNCWDFTREVFSPLKGPAYMQRFHTFMMIRRADDGVFPPSRLRIWSFYEHMWHALCSNGQEGLTGKSIRERAHEAHRLLCEWMRQDAQGHGIPIIENELLFDKPDNVARHIAPIFGDDTDRVTKQIVSTRKVKVFGG